MREHPTLWHDLRDQTDGDLQRSMAEYIEEDSYAEVARRFIDELRLLLADGGRALERNVQGIVQELKDSELTSSGTCAPSFAFTAH